MDARREITIVIQLRKQDSSLGRLDDLLLEFDHFHRALGPIIRPTDGEVTLSRVMAVCPKDRRLELELHSGLGPETPPVIALVFGLTIGEALLIRLRVEPQFATHHARQTDDTLFIRRSATKPTEIDRFAVELCWCCLNTIRLLADARSNRGLSNRNPVWRTSGRFQGNFGLAAASNGGSEREPYPIDETSSGTVWRCIRRALCIPSVSVDDQAAFPRSVRSGTVDLPIGSDDAWRGA